jgi:hypothetical protein
MLFDTINISEGSEILNATIASGTTFPTNPSIGELFYRTDEPSDGLYVYGTSGWELVGQGGTVDLSGLNVKAAVRATTVGNITRAGEQTIDGVVLVAGDRILVKDQTTPSQNGIYVVSVGTWSRSADFDGSPSTEVKAGDFVFVTEGTTYADSGWILTTNGTITIGSTSLTFSQFTGPSAAVAAGSSGTLQYNSGGTFAGAGGLVYDSGTQELTFTNLPKHDTFKLGYLGIPRTTVFGASSVGKRVVVSGSFTVNTGVFVAGDAISIYNGTDVDITITQGAGMTLRLDGTVATGSRTLLSRGTCLIWFDTASEAVVSGSVS